MQNDIKQALDVLKNGGVILYPTDAGWGLGCDATNPDAVKKIEEINGKTEPGNMVILMENPALLERYVHEAPDVAWDLVEISSTPLTVIFPGAKNLAANLISPEGSVGIRFTKEDFTTRLLQRFRRPVVAAPVAFGEEETAVFFDEISDEVKEQVDYIVEYRQDDITPVQPSGIIKLGPGGQIDIIRK